MNSNFVGKFKGCCYFGEVESDACFVHTGKSISTHNQRNVSTVLYTLLPMGYKVEINQNLNLAPIIIMSTELNFCGQKYNFNAFLWIQ